MLERIDFVCINLKSRSDRRLHMENIFRLLGIEVTWWSVDKHPVKGVYGCFESHFNVWSKHGTREYLFVFEDDVELVNDVSDFYRSIEALPDLDAQIINFSPSNIYALEMNKHGFKKGHFLDLAAYVIPRKYLPRVIDHVRPKYGLHIDVATLDILSFGKKVFRQIEDVGDNSYTYNKLQWTAKRLKEYCTETFPGIGLIILKLKICLQPNDDPGEMVDRR